MLTRRHLLGAALVLPVVPRASDALQPLRPANHWLNDRNSCLGWWLMAEGQYTPTTWFDLLARQQATFTAMASPGTATDGPYRGTQRRGQQGGQVGTNGTGGHVFVSGSFGSPAAISISLWVKTDAIEAGVNAGEVLSIRDSIVLRMVSGGLVRAIYRYATGSHTLTSSGTNYLGAGWFHLAWIVDPGQSVQNCFVNGFSVISGAQTDAISYTGAGTAPHTFLGRHPTATTNDLTGALDDLRVYNRLLSHQEVRLLWREGLTGYPTLLAAPTRLLASAPARHKRRSLLW